MTIVDGLLEARLERREGRLWDTGKNCSKPLTLSINFEKVLNIKRKHKAEISEQEESTFAISKCKEFQEKKMIASDLRRQGLPENWPFLLLSPHPLDFFLRRDV